MEDEITLEEIRRVDKSLSDREKIQEEADMNGFIEAFREARQPIGKKGEEN